MAAMAVGRGAVAPGVPRGEVAEQLVAAARDEGRFADVGRRITGGSHEARVLVLRDRKPSDEKFADVHAVGGPLVVVAVGAAHQEIASRNARERWRCG